MEQVKIELENCYGIKRMDHIFDFRKGTVISIYASNGSMKTSLAKSLIDYSNGDNPKDLYDPTLISKCTLNDLLNARPLDKEDVFVIKSFDESFKSEKMSLLLVNQKLKDQYEKITDDIEKEKESLIKKIKKLSSGSKKTDILKIILKDFSSKNIFEILKKHKDDILSEGEDQFSKIEYEKIFNNDTVDFLGKAEILKLIDSYIETFNLLVSQSNIISKGFNHSHLSNVNVVLEKNNFYAQGHKINLNKNGEFKEFKSSADVTKAYEEDLNKILEDQNLVEKFKEFDKKLSKEGLKDLREYISDNQLIISELSNIHAFKIKLWLSYFRKNKVDVENLLNSFDRSKSDIEFIINEAKKEENDWKKVVASFKESFSVPFEISVKNQEDVILNDSHPKLSFDIWHHTHTKINDIDENILSSTLSNGEKKAYYILNILFEIEIRKKNGNKTILIVDDIADSFDYKNKHAIIEMFAALKDSQQFKIIFLTHNFDFHRSICQKLDIYAENSFSSSKDNGKIILNKFSNKSHPFEEWNRKLFANDCDTKTLITSIPFYRNICEYTEIDPYSTTTLKVAKKLTAFLHIKNQFSEYIDTLQLTIGDLLSILNGVNVNISISNQNSGKNYYNELLLLSDSIVATPNQLLLEDKVILSIAIRLLAESYMIRIISNTVFTNFQKGNQTRKFYEKMKKDFSGDQNLHVLKQTMLIATDHIHLNSFMYEPLLDIDSANLVKLYIKLKSI